MKKVLSLIIALSMMGAMLPAAALAAENALLSYLSFDGGCGLDASANGAIYFYEGVSGEAPLFNGNAATYVSLNDSSLLVGKNAVTVTFWEKRSGGTWPLFIAPSQSAQTYNGENYIGLFDNGNEFKVERYVGGRGKATSSAVKADSYPAASKNGWRHVAIVLTDDRTDLYVDGALIKSQPSGSTLAQLFPSTAYIQLGRGNWGSGESFSGMIDEFKIFEGELSAEDIAAEAVYPAASLEDVLAAIDIPNADNIMDSITLADEACGVPVKWTSSNPAVVSDSPIPNGDYTIPAGHVVRGENDEAVTVTAEFTFDGEEKTVSYDLTVKARNTARENEEKVAYLYAYFRGNVRNSPQEHLQIHIASSEDGYKWTDLNGNWPILTSTMGTEGLRDPYIIRSRYGDKFYLIATDLNTLDAQGWGPWSLAGSKYLAIWESEDLVNWSEERLVKFANDDIGCAWAPEAIYDDDTDEYLVYAAGKDLTLSSPIDTVYVVRTRDFVTFSEPEIFFIPTDNNGKRVAAIDSSIIHADDGKYYHFYKKYNSEIHMMVSDHAAGPYEEVSAFKPIGGEGPAEYKVNNSDQYCLCVDNYSVYVPYLTDDIASGIFTKGDGEVKMPTGSKHGVMIPLTVSEYAGVLEAYGPKSPAAEGSEPVISYDFETAPEQGLNGNAAITEDEEKGNVLTLDGTNGTFFEIPSDKIKRNNSLTVSMDVKNNMKDGNFFTFAMGTDNIFYYFFRTRETAARAAITNGSWQLEEAAAAELPAETLGSWVHYDLVIEPNRLAVYKDGAKISENTAVETTAMHTGLENLKIYLGKSFFDDNAYFNGSFDNVKIYDRALSSQEIFDNMNYSPSEALDTDVKSLSVPKTLTEDIYLPVKGDLGSSITWQSSNEAVLSSDGKVNRPAMGEDDVTVKLVASLELNGLKKEVSFYVSVLAEKEVWKSAAASGNPWPSHEFTAFSDAKTVSFNVKASAKTDGVIGICGPNVSPNAWNSYSTIVRLTPDGIFDARSGSSFVAMNTVNYEVGKTYRVTMDINAATKNYSVYITDEDGKTYVLAKNYAYRSDAPATDSLGKISALGGSGVAGGLFEISDFKVSTYPCAIIDAVVTESTVSFKGSVSKEGPIRGYIAFYDNDGKLLKVDMADVNAVFGEPISFSADIFEGSTVAKLFIWDETAIPLSECRVKNIVK